MISLREASGFSRGRRPICASNGSVSSRIRPLDSAMLIMLMRSSLPASFDPPDAGAQRAQLLFKRLIAAVKVVDPVHQRLALRDEARDDEARGSAQIGRHHFCSLQLLD